MKPGEIQIDLTVCAVYYTAASRKRKLAKRPFFSERLCAKGGTGAKKETALQKAVSFLRECPLAGCGLHRKSMIFWTRYKCYRPLTGCGLHRQNCTMQPVVWDAALVKATLFVRPRPDCTPFSSAVQRFSPVFGVRTRRFSSIFPSLLPPFAPECFSVASDAVF